MKDAVLFKDEGRFGPVYLRRDGKLVNFKDSDTLSTLNGKPYPQWFTRRQAQQIAKKEGLPFEEV